MKVHHIYRQQLLSMDLKQAWDFFSSPYYLNRITPEFFHVRIDSPVPDKIYGGLLICYRMKAVFGIPMTWVSEISHCEEPHRFVYRQMAGPFKFWSHEVCLKEHTDGITVDDIVYYAIPFGWLGNLVKKYFIGPRLDEIFDYRAEYLENQWKIN